MKNLTTFNKDKSSPAWTDPFPSVPLGLEHLVRSSVVKDRRALVDVLLKMSQLGTLE